MFAGAAVLFVLAYMTLTFGRIQGEEFSPDVFRRREFSYYEIPLLGWQVWPDYAHGVDRAVGELSARQATDLAARQPAGTALGPGFRYTWLGRYAVDHGAQ